MLGQQRRFSGAPFFWSSALNARDALEALLEEVEYEEALLREYVIALVTVDSGSICGAKLEEC
jgi:hypothetical protein